MGRDADARFMSACMGAGSVGRSEMMSTNSTKLRNMRPESALWTNMVSEKSKRSQ